MAKRRGNREGSIFERENGTWRAQVTIGGQRLSFTGQTQKECRQWIRETLEKVEGGLTFEASRVTYGEFLSNWLTSIEASLRQKTHRQYEQIVRDHIAPYLGNRRLMELQPAHIQALYDRKVREGQGLRSVQLTHAVIHRSLNHAVKLGLLGRNPDDATTPPKPKQREMAILDESQVQRLLITAQARGDRNFALYQLAITTGMRQAELLGLKWDDVDWERRTLQVGRQLKRSPGKGYYFAQPKTRSGVRQIVMGVETTKVLKRHQERLHREAIAAGEAWQEQNLIFPTPHGMPTNKRYLVTQFKKLLKDAGLPNVRFHDLRHSAASLMLNHGVPVLIVSKRLGHAKPSITLDVYGHFIPGMQEQAADVMDEAVTPIAWKNSAKTAPQLHHADSMTS
jgi:integrase